MSCKDSIFCWLFIFKVDSSQKIFNRSVTIMYRNFHYGFIFVVFDISCKDDFKMGRNGAILYNHTYIHHLDGGKIQHGANSVGKTGEEQF